MWTSVRVGGRCSRRQPASRGGRHAAPRRSVSMVPEYQRIGTASGSENFAVGGPDHLEHPQAAIVSSEPLWPRDNDPPAGGADTVGVRALAVAIFTLMFAPIPISGQPGVPPCRPAFKAC